MPERPDAKQHVSISFIHIASSACLSAVTPITMSAGFNVLDLSDNEMDGDYEYHHEEDEDVMEEDEAEFTDEDEGSNAGVENGEGATLSQIVQGKRATVRNHSSC